MILVSSTGKVDQHTVDLGGAAEAAVADLRGRLNAALIGLSPAKAVERASSLLDELPARPAPARRRS